MKFTKTNIVRIAQAALALIALLLFFAPALTYKIPYTDKVVNFSGFQAWLGADVEVVSGLSFNAKLTFGGVLAIILVIVAIALPVTCLFVKKDVAKFLNYATIGVAAVAAIFLFCGTTGLMCSFDASSYSLGWGAIVAALLLIVEAAGSVATEFVIKD